MHRYQNYEVTDFLKDTTFRHWVYFPTAEEDRHWRQLVLQYPHLEPKIDTAHKLLLALSDQPVRREDIPEDKMLRTILNRIEEHKAPSRQQGRKLRRWVQIAASVALVAVCSLAYYFWDANRWDTIHWSASQYHETTTDYGEIREVWLPDSSRAVLNANSSLRYPTDWDQDESRELWLEGEAYFEVHRQRLHQKSLKKFVVHTGDLDVEVVGTKFNVYQGGESTEVALAEGAVRVNLTQADRPQTIAMTPGELITYSAEEASVTKTLVDTETYSAWQHRQLIFEGTPLRDVAQRLEEIFGYQVVFLDAAFANNRFRGTVPINDLEVLIQVLEKTYEIDITRSEQQLIFGERQSRQQEESPK